MTHLINKTPALFTELTDEWREYDIVKEGVKITIRIENPRFLNINTKHHAHRILDAQGVCHYIPAGFVALRWKVRDGTPHFHTTVAQPDGSVKQVKHS